MNELTFCRIDLRAGEEVAREAVEDLLDSGVLVPVERCEHGNIDGHEKRNEWTNEYEGWCLGAGIGDNDE